MELIPVMLYHISIIILNNQDLLSNLIITALIGLSPMSLTSFLQGVPYINCHNNVNVIPGRF